MREFAPQPAGVPLDNDSYGRVGADLLHGVVRGLKPRRIVELGSGHSTLFMAAAAERNRGRGRRDRAADLRPVSRASRGPGCPASPRSSRCARRTSRSRSSRRSRRATCCSSTPRTRSSSTRDVNRIVLDVLPALAPGVLVHVHDIFLPYEYPRQLARGVRLPLGRAVPAAGVPGRQPGFEVLAATFALCRDRPDAMARLAPTWRPGAEASAFWFRSTAGPAAPPPAPRPPHG